MSPESDTGFALPTGMVTVVAAQVEESPSQGSSDDELRQAISARDLFAADLFRAYGGVSPKEPWGETEGYLAVFARPSEAISCAVELQIAFAGQEVGGHDIALRVGLHTGEIQLRDEGSYIGQTMNRAARLRDVGHGGQILVSQPTYGLTVDRLPKGLFYKDLGVHRLRDLSRAEQIFQLCHEDLTAEFPALKSLDAFPNNLPTQLSSFVGRRQEIAELKLLLNQTRALTLIGSGGSGKTRLALQVAADEAESFPDGVWLVDLSSISEPDAIAGVAAAALGQHEQQSMTTFESLAKSIDAKRTLLILDNCEQLIDRCAELASHLLTRCPSISLLVTSREPLGVPGETIWRVPPLSIPTEASATRVEAVTHYDAVELFIERARKSRPGFEVTNENASSVATICHRLDGIPLAIELAAARIRVLSPRQILAGLSDRFLLLAGGSRRALPRQQTLQASIDWSYELLTIPERAAFRRLAVFAGGFTLEAARFVCAFDGIEEHQVLDLLSLLVDKSLLLMEEIDQQARYRLTETINQYALQRLVESGEENQARNRHCDFFRLFAKEAFRSSYGLDQDSWVELLDSDNLNLRSAFLWNERHQDAESLLAFAASMAPYWILRYRTHEVRTGLEAALAVPSDVAPDMRAMVLNSLALMHYGLGNLGDMNRLAQESLTITQSIGDKAGQAWAMTLLGWGDFDFDSKREHFEQAVAQAREGLNGEADGTPHVFTPPGHALWILAFSLEGLGWFYSMAANDSRRALPVLNGALDVATRSGAHAIVRRALTWRGFSESLQGEAEKAEKTLRGARRLAEETSDSFIQAHARYWLAAAMRDRGDYEGAKSALVNASFSELGPFIGPSFSRMYQFGQAEVAFAEGSVQEAIDAVEEMAAENPLPHHGRLLAEAYLAQGNPSRAREALDRGGWETPWSEPWVCLRLATEGRLLRAEGDLAGAEDGIHEALGIFVERGNRAEVARCLETLASIALELESHVEAARLLGAAQGLFDALGVVRWKVFQSAHEEDSVHIREAIGDERFDEAWTEGAGMSETEAIAYATRGRGERKRPTSGWASLTPTELQVAAHVSEGLKSADVAEKLFVSRSTVETHLKHIYAKLGISSRTELALEAVRKGIRTKAEGGAE